MNMYLCAASGKLTISVGRADWTAESDGFETNGRFVGGSYTVVELLCCVLR